MSLDDIKAGDEVYYSPGGWYPIPQIVAIIRVTKTQIIIKGDFRFRKKDGRPVGCDDIWRLAYIRSIKEEDVKEVEEKNAFDKICHTKWENIPHEKIKRILEIIDEPENDDRVEA